MRSFHRVASALAVLGLMSVHLGAICHAGPTTDVAPTACCAPGSDCPSHGSDSSVLSMGAASRHAPLAATCCALSERRQSGQVAFTFAPSITAAVLDTATIAPAAWTMPADTGAWRSPAPPRPAHVPTHILLSVFLV